MRMRDFIREHGAEIDRAINETMFKWDGKGGKGKMPIPAPTYSNEERRQWIQNDEGLYNWARREGVKV